MAITTPAPMHIHTPPELGEIKLLSDINEIRYLQIIMTARENLIANTAINHIPPTNII